MQSAGDPGGWTGIKRFTTNPWKNLCQEREREKREKNEFENIKTRTHAHTHTTKRKQTQTNKTKGKEIKGNRMVVIKS